MSSAQPIKLIRCHPRTALELVSSNGLAKMAAYGATLQLKCRENVYPLTSRVHTQGDIGCFGTVVYHGSAKRRIILDDYPLLSFQFSVNRNRQ